MGSRTSSCSSLYLTLGRSETFAKSLEPGDLSEHELKVDGNRVSFQNLLAKISFLTISSRGESSLPRLPVRPLGGPSMPASWCRSPWTAAQRPSPPNRLLEEAKARLAARGARPTTAGHGTRPPCRGQSAMRPGLSCHRAVTLPTSQARSPDAAPAQGSGSSAGCPSGKRNRGPAQGAARSAPAGARCFWRPSEAPAARDPAGGTCSLRRQPRGSGHCRLSLGLPASRPCVHGLGGGLSPGRGSVGIPGGAGPGRCRLTFFPVRCRVSWLASFGKRWGCGTPGPSCHRRLRRARPTSCLGWPPPRGTGWARASGPPRGMRFRREDGPQ